MNDPLGFTQRESYAIARFYAMEYMARNGSKCRLCVYMNGDVIKYLAPDNKFNIPGTTLIECTAKELVLWCLFNEYPNVNKLAFVLYINRYIDKATDLLYAKKIGVDVSTYRLIEKGYICNKGLLKLEDGKTMYQFDPELICDKLGINKHELKISIGGTC